MLSAGVKLQRVCSDDCIVFKDILNNKKFRSSLLSHLNNMAKEVRTAAYSVWPDYPAGSGSMNGVDGPDLPPH